MTLTHTQERALYLSDHTQWLAYAAPRLLERMRMEPETKVIRWKMASPALRSAVNDLLKLEKAA
jgi:hypothetical protein